MVGRPTPSRLSAFRESLAQSPGWTKVFDEDDVLVFRRAPEGEGSVTSRLRERGPLELVVLGIEVLLLGSLPLAALYYIFLNVVHGGQVTDFENAFYPAAEAVLRRPEPLPGRGRSVARQPGRRTSIRR